MIEKQETPQTVISTILECKKHWIGSPCYDYETLNSLNWQNQLQTLLQTYNALQHS